MPVDPPPSPWEFPAPPAGADDLIAVGADLAPGTLLSAYRRGYFPMPLDDEIGWWSPRHRGVLPLDGLRMPRSLRKSRARFDIRVDTAFSDVVDACADPRRPGGWISSSVRAAYV
ncbi:MAG: leucyl/phenylalanyl-tRNA--protein transferase, partial [Nocardioides sp.]|nr:leucyl/phenylalanyl-tRNA--protein transferase [Nocardioides sp.]